MTDVAALSVLAFFAGAAFGASYLYLVRRSVAALADGGSAAKTVVFALLRLAGAGVFFGFAAALGLLPVLFALAGFAAARLLLLRRMGEGLE